MALYNFQNFCAFLYHHEVIEIMCAPATLALVNS